MELELIKEKIIQAIDENRREIIAIGTAVQNNPETGYREEKTSKLVRETFQNLGISYRYPVAYTGVKGTLPGRHADSTVCIIGEMDALKCAGSVIADEAGNAHACGHNAQTAAMLGAAIGLSRSGVMAELDGNVSFMAAPAEEFIELDYRKQLRDEGKIQYFGGKQQLIAEGAFDDIDMAMMIHARPDQPEPKLYTRGHTLGFMAKTITFHGKAVHGSTPFDGVNALNAASLAILGIHANRETFREEDRIRIHPIITKGGDVVNSVPDEVIIDTYIRGATREAIMKGNTAVERAVSGAAQMVGAHATAENIPGYLPLRENPELSDIIEENAGKLLGPESVICGQEVTGSTDMGDLSHIMPVIHPTIGGFAGSAHSREFHVTDEETAYILSAKLLALTVADLLYDRAHKARSVMERFEPQMSKDAYLKYLQDAK